jgi:hypothetical protein
MTSIIDKIRGSQRCLNLTIFPNNIPQIYNFIYLLIFSGVKLHNSRQQQQQPEPQQQPQQQQQQQQHPMMMRPQHQVSVS